MSLVEVLKKNRPNLSDSSLKTYTSILRSIYKKIFGNEEIDIKKYKETDNFFDLLKDKEGNQRKTYLSALYILTGIEKYQKEMVEDAKNYNEQNKLQKMDDKQKENWITQDELRDVYKKLETKTKLFYKMDKLSSKHIQEIQNYVMLALMSGVESFPIRRLMDWSEMKFRSYDEKTDNFLKKGKGVTWSFCFNKYKTKKVYNEQVEGIPTKLLLIVKKWIKLLMQYYPDNDYLLIDSDGGKMNSPKLNKRLNSIFGKNTSINIIRHSFITEKYKNLPALKEMQEEAEKFGHDVLTHMLYIKK